MKYLFSLFFIFSVSIAEAKFASWVVQIPCDKMTLKVSACKEFTFSNRDKLPKEELKKRKDTLIERKGAILTASIESVEPMKCHAKQEIDLKRFKKRDFKIKKFFVQGLKCKKEIKKIVTKRVNFFCDTPGAPSVPDCFIPETSRKNEFVYTELIK